MKVSFVFLSKELHAILCLKIAERASQTVMPIVVTHAFASISCIALYLLPLCLLVPLKSTATTIAGRCRDYQHTNTLCKRRTATTPPNLLWFEVVGRVGEF